MAVLVLLGILACLWLAWRAWWRKSDAEAWLEDRGLPAGATTIGQDLVADHRWAGQHSIADPRIRLRGTVDHLLRTKDGRLVVAEVKITQRLPDRPHDPHEVQLGAYMLLCARDRAVREEPAYSLLTYRTPDGDAASFRVENGAELRARTIETLDALRRAETAATVRRSHEQPGRCRHCGWSEWCEDRLGPAAGSRGAGVPADPAAPRRASRGGGLRWIGARELAEFSYCARSWAFRRRYGDPSDPRAIAAMQAGRRLHAEEGAERADAEGAVRRGRWWWIWLLLAGWLLWWHLRGR